MSEDLDERGGGGALLGANIGARKCTAGWTWLREMLFDEKQTVGNLVELIGYVNKIAMPYNNALLLLAYIVAAAITCVIKVNAECNFLSLIINYLTIKPIQTTAHILSRPKFLANYPYHEASRLFAFRVQVFKIITFY